jgi:hypothetical protein
MRAELLGNRAVEQQMNRLPCEMRISLSAGIAWVKVISQDVFGLLLTCNPRVVL